MRASRPALLDLLLKRAECLIRGAANGADQGGAILNKRSRGLAHEPLLQRTGRRLLAEQR